MLLNSEESKLEKELIQYNKDIELMNALIRLRKNKDFNLVITKGYLTDEALRLVKRKCSVSGEEETQLIRQLDSISNLQNYFDVLTLNAEIAQKSVKDAEHLLELMAEEFI